MMIREARPTSAVALRWRIVRDGARSGPTNMALDHALARCVDGGEGVVRLYTWERPTVSFGRNEPAGGYSTEAARDRGIGYVRRPTGGRAVLHDREITYSVVAPARALGGPRQAYHDINRALASGLIRLGASVDLSGGSRSRTPDAGPCFGTPAAGEVIAAGGKLVGSAQARIGSVLLQHGSIILEGDQSVLAELSASARRGRAPATLRGLIGEVSDDDVCDAVVEALKRAFGGSWTPGEYTAAEAEDAELLEMERYSRDSWTWRR